ncbi:tRNA (cytidine(34)-2'-O)-methyltransferase [Oxobacter pfennigii]|uniref:Putative tRNA (cytidine(34)-2'-O)-methyltransferase n=1 Tax=Oxobacter pfennigii TaxID=36849 RepID=A0A0P8W9E4_9CLOT|nr:tRNA (uridine(34)/cytosine(34)/5-carboxymethylaminomethyluridine(34)-2'-O)-methyltransferase TrmL [Oxobacter pfennigii]KPU45268.1 tRNA (cytidine(34)-2'-O)-methyltransferase [Oxobacter pfennigii]
MNLNIVMLEPEIPQNTGNIARSCVLTKSTLHLVKPLGFSTDDKSLKRAGLDYWQYLDIRYYDSLEELYEEYRYERFFYATTKAKKLYTDIEFQKGDFLVFGKESAGLPKELIEKNIENCMRIPMIKESLRSLNLSNSVNIIMFEALRQLDFPDMK